MGGVAGGGYGGHVSGGTREPERPEDRRVMKRVAAEGEKKEEKIEGVSVKN